MPLKDRRNEYSWPETIIDQIKLSTAKERYSIDEDITLTLKFRLVGGLREAFNPEVWTIAWEDYDKNLRLMLQSYIGIVRVGFMLRKVTEVKKEVRKATFYWSRDPDLPYRIWTLIIPEDGGAPKIPASVEDAKSKMFDFTKRFDVSAALLGRGKHKLVGIAKVKWGRRSYIEKGEVSRRSEAIEVYVE